MSVRFVGLDDGMTSCGSRNGLRGGRTVTATRSSGFERGDRAVRKNPLLLLMGAKEMQELSFSRYEEDCEVVLDRGFPARVKGVIPGSPPD